MAGIACPHCGTTNRRGAAFCSNCGTDLRGEPPAPLGPTGEAAQPTAPFSPEQIRAGGEPEHLASEPAPGALPASAPATEEPAAQPWLQPDFLGADDVPFAPEEDSTLADIAFTPPPARLVGGIQGLLDPVRVTALGEVAAAAGLPPAAGLAPDQVRRVRTLMAEEPLLASTTRGRPRRGAALRNTWIFLIVGLAIALPLFLNSRPLAGFPDAWPGVEPAFSAVAGLSPETPVLVLWAYDPAMAGELDVVAKPVLSHLLAQGAQMTVYSLMPNGPATARRVIAAVQKELQATEQPFGEPLPADVTYLPGGVTVLPLVGQEQAALAVVFAAQAQDVQQWLEQVQPLNQVPTVAVTAAGAAPLLQPYQDSGQLTGLVSGYDGAAAYTADLNNGAIPAGPSQLQRQIVGQNYGLLAFLAIVVLGNIAALLTGRRRDA